MKRFHFVQDLIAAMKASDEEKVSMFINKDGTRPTVEQVHIAIANAYAHGYDVVPSCENHDDKGYCLGHEESE